MPARERSTVADPAAKPKRKPGLLTALGVLVALAILLSLGTWQVERLYWKEGLLAELDRRIHAPPEKLADIEALARSGGDVDYRPTEATGRFDNSSERHFLATWRGQSGFYIYTPLTLADGRSLFVNRGFVPYENKEPEKRVLGQLTDIVTVRGLARARLSEKPGSLVPDNDLAKNIFYWKDLDAMASSTGLDPARVLPFFLDADATPNPAGFPIGGVTMVELPNNHLQYAVTWYGLAAALAAISGIAWWRSRQA
ncbi:SURF1 family protein [Gellertiella hungarica]|uniref:SURF1 family protein n=1 Tax=Gellertiella hungarica TaxID=1572859 RepID=UPI00160A77B8|nr:SURF1 family protein [Gellertiella hungarica]